MAITSWTSEGMTWPPTAGFRLYNPLEAIRLAVNERATVTSGVSTVGTFGFSAGYSPRDLMDDIQTAMSGLISADKWVKYTDSSGNWDGQTDVPRYDEASLLSAIGAGSRLPVPDPGYRPNDWIYQQYLLLNKLRWSYDESSVTTSAFSANGDTGEYIASDAVWATALAAYGSASPAAGGSYYPHVGSSWEVSRSLFFAHRAEDRIRVKASHSAANIPSMDYYPRAGNPPFVGSLTTALTQDYNDLGEGYTTGYLYLMSTSAPARTVSGGNAYYLTQTIAPGGTPVEPDSASGVDTAEGYQLKDGIAVYKWDIAATGQFAFID
jgi:hypothetical protein